MRDLTRSVLRLSLAVPLLGLDQAVRLMTSRDRNRPLEPATETIESLADAAYRQLGPSMRDVYEQGDRLQEQVLDLMFRWMPGADADDRNPEQEQDQEVDDVPEA